MAALISVATVKTYICRDIGLLEWCMEVSTINFIHHCMSCLFVQVGSIFIRRLECYTLDSLLRCNSSVTAITKQSDGFEHKLLPFDIRFEDCKKGSRKSKVDLHCYITFWKKREVNNGLEWHVHEISFLHIDTIIIGFYKRWKIFPI